jgi:hypothetical protein
MATLTFEDKLKITKVVVDTVNRYWIICEGELFNNKEFWDETFHSLTNEDWEDMMKVMDYVAATEPQLISSSAENIFGEVKKILMYEGHSGNPQALDARRHKKTEFKALMWIKDIFNEISGYEQPTTFPKDEPPTPFETFFQRGD